MYAAWFPRLSILAQTRNYLVLLTVFFGFFRGNSTLAGQSIVPSTALSAVGEGWPTYGGDPGGLRFSNSSQITRSNVHQLHPVWTFHTNGIGLYPATYGRPSFETTPVLSGDTLFLTSPYDVIFALNASTGAERWHFDPKLMPLVDDGGILTSRGVALWPLGTVPEPNSPACTHRVFIGTLDARLIAIDASTGRPCSDFGSSGFVDLRQGVNLTTVGSYRVTSPPTVVGNVVVVGSSITDNRRVDPESGLVRGYNTITGKLIWTWEPLPWADKQKVRTGAANTWSVISADPILGLVYLPTGSAAPDYYGGMRPGDDRDADSIVALEAATGKKVWSFQVVHHDLWDYDIASEPVLFTWRGTTPAIAVTTKMGMIFLFDRRNGKPLLPIEERPVPQSDVPGEQTSPTQPFQQVPPLAPLTLTFTDTPNYHRSAADTEICRKEFAALRYDGIYTPPSLQGSVHHPSNYGGVNWGGAAIDPNTGILYANTNRLAFSSRLIRRHSVEQYLPSVYASSGLTISITLLAVLLGCVLRRSFYPGWAPLLIVAACVALLVAGHVHDASHWSYYTSDQAKSPYLIENGPITDRHHVYCAPAPWGGITAVNLNTLTTVWEKPLGSLPALPSSGIVNFGGPIVTASGLVITAGTEDSSLRVFDAAIGEELQKLSLDVPAIATPMTYTLDGRQYIVIADGGHYNTRAPLGDSLIAFAVDK